MMCNRGRYTIRISLHIKDIDILLKFNQYLNHNKPLHYSKNTSMVELEIANKYMSNRMLELGVMPRKTFLLEFPIWIDPNIKHHFLRGYFDGDGSVGVYKPPKSKPVCLASLVSTESFCFTVRDTLKKLNINCYIRARHPERNTNTRQLHIGGSLQAKRFLDFIYKDATIYLDRKFNIYRNFYYSNAN